MSEDLYEILGVTRDASPAAIKAAYRALARQHHPDVGGDPETFVAIGRAYRILVDPDTREDYDLAGVAREENALAMQHYIMESLADLYKTVLAMADERISEVNIVESMKNVLLESRQEHEIIAKTATKMIKMLEFAKTRIKTKDSGKNVFLEISDVQIKKNREIYANASKNLRMMDAVMEELMRHDSITDVVRSQFFGFGRPMYQFDKGGFEISIFDFKIG